MNRASDFRTTSRNVAADRARSPFSSLGFELQEFRKNLRRGLCGSHLGQVCVPEKKEGASQFFTSPSL